jgi:hypothetical protein
MKETKSDFSTITGSAIGIFAVILACVSLIEGEFQAAFWFAIGGAVGMLLIAKFTR